VALAVLVNRMNKSLRRIKQLPPDTVRQQAKKKAPEK
jgi:hypothetical protein